MAVTPLKIHGLKHDVHTGDLEQLLQNARQKVRPGILQRRPPRAIFEHQKFRKCDFDVISIHAVQQFDLGQLRRAFRHDEAEKEACRTLGEGPKDFDGKGLVPVTLPRRACQDGPFFRIRIRFLDHCAQLRAMLIMSAAIGSQ